MCADTAANFTANHGSLPDAISTPMNDKKAKALRQAVRAFASAPFNGKAANDAYLRAGNKAPIKLDQRSPRFVYKQAKKKLARDKHVA